MPGYRVVGALFALSVGVLGCAVPSVEGGWSGRAICENVVHKTDAMFHDEGNDEISGVFFVEWNVGTFLIPVTLTLRGELEDAEFKPFENKLSGKIDTDGSSDPDFSFELAYPDKEEAYENLEGTLSSLKSDGDKSSTCELELTRVTK